MREMIGCCGLDCERCDAYVATITNDDVLREKTAQLWSEMNHASITKDMINCMGCRVAGPKTPYCESLCEIRKCVQRKGFESCGDCGDLGRCAIIATVVDNAPDALRNLKEQG